MARRIRTRPLLAATLLVATAAPMLAGCEPWHRQRVRRPAEPPILPESSAAGADDPSLQHPEELRGFFKPNRSAGAWSREARDIERSLGALP